MLAKGEALAPRTVPAIVSEAPDEDAWLGYLYARILLDEAVTLVEGPIAGDSGE